MSRSRHAPAATIAPERVKWMRPSAGSVYAPRRMHVAPRPESGSFSVRTRLGVLAGSFIAVLLVAGAVSAVLVDRWVGVISERGDLRQAATDVAEVRLALSDQESGVRGYVLAGEEQFLEPFEDGIVRERAALLALGNRDLDVPGLAERVAAVEAAATTWRLDAAARQIEARRSGLAVPDELLDDGMAEFDAVRRELDALELVVRDAVGEAEHSADRLQQRTLGVLAAGFVLAVVSATAVAFAFRRWVTMPLAAISSSAREIARGEPAAMPTYDAVELDAVSQAVDVLQRSLSAERDRAVQAYEGLEQSAVLALHVRSELTADEHFAVADGWTLASTVRSAEGVVAGDCYDVGLVNSRTLYLVMIDVTGHGAVAALNALKAKSLLRSALKSGMPPGDALGWLSRHGAEQGDLDYLTAFVAAIEFATGACRYANAGHPPALLTVGEDDPVELPATGPLLGPFPASWPTETATLPPASSLVIYTDGLTEALGAERERLGEDRVKRVLAESEAGDAHAVVGELTALLDGFRVARQTDDVSIVCVARDASAAPDGAASAG